MGKRLKVRAGALEWREVEGEIVALDVRRSLYLAINPSGAVLWPALLAGATQDDLVAELSARCQVDRESAEGDVEAFISNLREHDLLETG